ncbi:MAG: stage III sporulation protein AF [Clostridia bacterium]|nr:stage III sporulation protein AF [Clostridia bacterium]
MEGLREWATGICTAAVVCALLRHLFPDNGLGRMGRLVIPCVFLLALLAPVSAMFSDIKLPDFTSENTENSAALEARMRQQVTQQVNDTLLAMVNQALQGYGWQAKKVAADMDIGEDGSISMGEIIVYVDRETAPHSVAVRQIAEKRLGTAVVLAEWEERE